MEPHKTCLIPPASRGNSHELLFCRGALSRESWWDKNSLLKLTDKSLELHYTIFSVQLRFEIFHNIKCGLFFGFFVFPWRIKEQCQRKEVREKLKQGTEIKGCIMHEWLPWAGSVLNTLPTSTHSVKTKDRQVQQCTQNIQQTNQVINAGFFLVVIQSLSRLWLLQLCSPSWWLFMGFSKNTGVGCHSLLQGIFPTHGPNPCLLHCRQIFCWATGSCPEIVTRKQRES